jgi:hypothetical protein
VTELHNKHLTFGAQGETAAERITWMDLSQTLEVITFVDRQTHAVFSMMQFITLNLALFASFLKMHFSLISLYRADATP